MAHQFIAELDLETLWEGVAKAKAGDKLGAAVDFSWVGGCALYWKQGGGQPIVGAAASSNDVAGATDDELLALIEVEAPAQGAVAASGLISSLLISLLMEFAKRYL